jgi:hypothetical protein
MERLGWDARTDESRLRRLLKGKSLKSKVQGLKLNGRNVEH